MPGFTLNDVPERWRNHVEALSRGMPLYHRNSQFHKELVLRLNTAFFQKYNDDVDAKKYSVDVRVEEAKKGKQLTIDQVTLVKEHHQTKPTQFKPLHIYEARAYSYLLGALSIIEHFPTMQLLSNEELRDQAGKEHLANEKRKPYFRVLWQIINAQDNKSPLFKFFAKIKAYPEPWSEKHFQAANQHFDDFLECLASQLPDDGLGKQLENLIKAERYVAAELGRPNYESTRRVNGVDGTPYRMVRTKRPVYYLTEEQKAEWRCIFDDYSVRPHWFKNLPQWEQSFLRRKVREAEKTGNWFPLMLTKSSTERLTPGLVNHFEEEETWEPLDAEGQPRDVPPVLHTVSATFGVPSPVSNQHDVERRRQCLQNMAQHIESLGFERAAVEAKQQGSHQFEIPHELIKQFLMSWNFPENIKMKDVKPIVGQPDPRPCFELVLPVSMPGYLTPAPYEAGSIGRFIYKVGGSEDNNNLTMFRDKEAAMRQITFKPRLVEIGGKLVFVKAETRKPCHPVNDRRGLLAKEVDNSNRIAAKHFVRTTVNNLVTLALINDIPEGDDTFLTYIKNLNNIVNGLEDVSKAGRRIDGISQQIGYILASPTALNAFGLEKRLALTMHLHALRDYIELKNYRGRYLKRNYSAFLASYEKMVEETGSELLGDHCRSSRDRRTFVAIHTHAMKRYFLENGRLPQYGDNQADRDKFEMAFRNEYWEADYLDFGGFNSPGSCGIKDEDTGILGQVVSIADRPAPTYSTGMKNKISGKEGKEAEPNNLLVAASYACRLNKPYPGTWRKKAVLYGIMGIALVCTLPFVFHLLGAAALVSTACMVVGSLVGGLIFKATGRSFLEGMFLGAVHGLAASLLLPAIAVAAGWWLKCAAVGAGCGLLGGLLSGRSVWKSMLVGALAGTAIAGGLVFGAGVTTIAESMTQLTSLADAALGLGTWAISYIGSGLAAIVAFVTGYSIWPAIQRNRALKRDKAELDAADFGTPDVSPALGGLGLAAGLQRTPHGNRVAPAPALESKQEAAACPYAFDDLFRPPSPASRSSRRGESPPASPLSSPASDVSGSASTVAALA